MCKVLLLKDRKTNEIEAFSYWVPSFRAMKRNYKKVTTEEALLYLRLNPDERIVRSADELLHRGSFSWWYERNKYHSEDNWRYAAKHSAICTPLPEKAKLYLRYEGRYREPCLIVKSEEGYSIYSFGESRVQEDRYVLHYPDRWLKSIPRKYKAYDIAEADKAVLMADLITAIRDGSGITPGRKYW